MSMKFTRRDVLKTAAAGGTVAATSSFPFINSVHAAEPLSVVDWGPPWIDHAKKTGEAWGKAEINWTLHSGGAASILPKIKAAWPNPPYDLGRQLEPGISVNGSRGLGRNRDSGRLSQPRAHPGGIDHQGCGW